MRSRKPSLLPSDCVATDQVPENPCPRCGYPRGEMRCFCPACLREYEGFRRPLTNDDFDGLARTADAIAATARAAQARVRQLEAAIKKLKRPVRKEAGPEITSCKASAVVKQP